MSSRRRTFAASIFAASLVALSASGYLAWVAWRSGTPIGCGLSSVLNCDEVLASRWSHSFGAPVSVLAIPVYLTVLALLWPAAKRPEGLAMMGLLTLGVAALLSAVWMVGLQAFVLESFCLYCLVAHICGVIVGISAIAMALDGGPERDTQQMRSLLGVAAHRAAPSPGRRRLSPRHMAAATVIATLAVAAMATGQWLEEEVRPELQEIALASATEPEPTIPSASSQTAEIAKTLDEAAADPAEPAPASRTFSFKALPKSIRLSDEPVLGSPQAEHVVVELIDYTCKHCRQMHPFLRKAVERYDGQLAVVVLHTPLSSKCNPSAPAGRKGKRGACEYAQVALGVWRYDPSEFGGFHYWLMEGDKPPSILDANKRAAALFGDPFLLDSKRKDDAQRRITRNGAVLQRVNVGLPVLLFPESAISGVPAGEVEFFQLLETKLGLTLPTDAADN